MYHRTTCLIMWNSVKHCICCVTSQHSEGNSSKMPSTCCRHLCPATLLPLVPVRSYPTHYRTYSRCRNKNRVTYRPWTAASMTLIGICSYSWRHNIKLTVRVQSCVHWYVCKIASVDVRRACDRRTCMSLMSYHQHAVNNKGSANITNSSSSSHGSCTFLWKSCLWNVGQVIDVKL